MVWCCLSILFGTFVCATFNWYINCSWNSTPFSYISSTRRLQCNACSFTGSVRVSKMAIILFGMFTRSNQPATNIRPFALFFYIVLFSIHYYFWMSIDFGHVLCTYRSMRPFIFRIWWVTRHSVTVGLSLRMKPGTFVFFISENDVAAVVGDGDGDS